MKMLMFQKTWSQNAYTPLVTYFYFIFKFSMFSLLLMANDGYSTATIQYCQTFVITIFHINVINTVVTNILVV